MSRDLLRIDPPNETDRRLLAEVKRYGWTVAVVPADEEDPGRAHTIGLVHSYKHPEVVVYGLMAGDAIDLLRLIASCVKEGQRFESGKCYDSLLDDDRSVCFLPVRRDEYDRALGAALRLYKSDRFEAVQCVWPDPAGRFPWDDKANDVFHIFQPLLGPPPKSA